MHRPHSASASGPRAAFTLIELLVVIAIIAILAAILFPVFAQARDKARQTACLSNMKQIGIGIMMYKQDYDETYPSWRSGSNFVPPATATNIHGWGDSFQSYVKNTQIMQCPSELNGPVNPTRPDQGGWSDYCYNKWLGNGTAVTTGNVGDPGVPEPISDAETQAPAYTIMVTEAAGQHSRSVCNGNAGIPGFNGVPVTHGIVTNNGSTGETMQHNEGASYCFADGHAKWYKGDTIFHPNTGKQAQIWSKIILEKNTAFAQSGSNPTFHYKDGVILP